MAMPPWKQIPAKTVPQVPGAAPAPWKPQVPGGTPAQPDAPVTAGGFARMIPSGLRAGYESLAGMGGDIYNLEVSAAEKLAQWLGASPETLAEIKASRGQNWMPSSQEVTEASSGYLGEPTQPQNAAERLIHTGAGFAINPAKGFVRNVVAPAIGTEVGGEIGKQYDHETIGRLLGGLGGATATGGVQRGLVGPKVDPTRRGLINTLQQEGVELTGGQASGRKGLQYAETGPFETKSANIAQQQGEQFSKAVLQRAGITADRASPGVMDAAQDNFSNRYTGIIRRAGGVPLDPTLEHDLLANIMDYERLTGVSGKSAVGRYFQEISDAAQANGNVVPADVFQSISSRIAADLKKMRGNPGQAEAMIAMKDFRDRMFDSVGRNQNPTIVKEWKELNNQYRNFKIIEKAMGGAGEATAEGMVTPQKLRGAVEQGDRGGYVKGRGDFADLARAGEATMKPLPQSGTAARGIGAAALAGAGERLYHGDLWGAGAVAAGAGLPAALAKTLTAKPVRTALVRQATDPLPMLDRQTLALLLQQNQPREGGLR